jgi:predicted PurR-regulated permease PerM
MAQCNKKEFQRTNLLSPAQVSFAVLFALFAILAWQVVKPLMSGIAWAAILAFIVRPVFAFFHERMLKCKFRTLATCLTLFVASVAVIIPLLLILFSLGSEITVIVSKTSDLITSDDSGDRIKDLVASASATLPSWANRHLQSFFTDSESMQTLVRNGAKWFGVMLTGFSKVIIQRASSFALETVILLMVSFFFIRDGRGIMRFIKDITPLDSKEKDRFFLRATNLVNAVLYGMVLTVLIQAIVGALGWWFVGLPNPALFGTLMFVFGMLPVGTALIWVPGSIYLLAAGDFLNGTILFVWGALIVGTVDNFLRPFLISKGGHGEEIPTLLVILGLFGGVIAWGFLGVFLGPLVIVLFILVLQIYHSRNGAPSVD